MKTILHISADFPDPMVGAKTRSVLNLVEAADGYRHVIYSLNRANWKTGVTALRFAPDRTALAYGAPPKGIQHASRLKPVTAWILDDVRSQGVEPDLIHAHKMSVEGLIAVDLSQALGAPFVCDIWGDTDLKITETRFDLAPKWREVLASARAVFACAPWATDRFEARWGLDRSKTTVLPPIVQSETLLASTPCATPRLMTLFNLNVHRRKNFAGLVQATMQLKQTTPAATLDVWGVGGPEAFSEVDAIIRDAGAQGTITLRGRLPEGQFERTLNSYSAFVMPTLRETFGMVFVEALFCGLPLLYTKGWSIDGLFDPDEIGYACESSNTDDIRAGLEHLVRDEARLKTSIAALQARGGLRPYTRAGVVETYRAVVDSAIGGGATDFSAR